MSNERCMTHPIEPTIKSTVGDYLLELDNCPVCGLFTFTLWENGALIGTRDCGNNLIAALVEYYKEVSIHQHMTKLKREVKS